MSLYDTSYKHWRGTHRSIWHRRWAISWLGLRMFLDGKWNRNFVVASWILSVLAAVGLYYLGQLINPDSFGERDLLPSTYGLYFYYYTEKVMHWFAMFAVLLSIPHLVTQDIASRAIVIYSSKSISRFDYFLGKFGTVLGVFCIVWILPMLLVWLLGILMAPSWAPSWSFLWHSKGVLLRAMSSGLLAAVVLSLLAMGISAFNNRPRNAVAQWIMIWFVGSQVASRSSGTWLRHLSITGNMEELSKLIFRPEDCLDRFRMDWIRPPGSGVLAPQIEVIVLGWIEDFVRQLHPSLALDSQIVLGSACALGAMVLVSLLVLHLRVKPE